MDCLVQACRFTCRFIVFLDGSRRYETEKEVKSRLDESCDTRWSKVACRSLRKEVIWQYSHRLTHWNYTRNMIGGWRLQSEAHESLLSASILWTIIATDCNWTPRHTDSVLLTCSFGEVDRCSLKDDWLAVNDVSKCCRVLSTTLQNKYNNVVESDSFCLLMSHQINAVS
jgi:hypothetical protein